VCRKRGPNTTRRKVREQKKPETKRRKWIVGRNLVQEDRTQRDLKKGRSSLLTTGGTTNQEYKRTEPGGRKTRRDTLRVREAPQKTKRKNKKKVPKRHLHGKKNQAATRKKKNTG